MSARLAVVTGASRGIGLALAMELASRDYDVVVCAEDPDIALAAEAVQRMGRAATAVEADLASIEGVEMLLEAIDELARPVDAVAINAGVGVWGPFIETPLEDDLRLIALNVSSAVHLAKALLPAMVQRGDGRVLVTSSVAAVQPGPWYATYAASKSFLLSFAEALRHELKDTGVTVTALMPGPTDTGFFERAGMEGTVVDSQSKDDPADVARDAVEGLLAGRDHVVAGSLRNKLLAWSKAAPEPVKAALHAAMTKQKG